MKRTTSIVDHGLLDWRKKYPDFQGLNDRELFTLLNVYDYYREDDEDPVRPLELIDQLLKNSFFPVILNDKNTDNYDVVAIIEGYEPADESGSYPEGDKAYRDHIKERILNAGKVLEDLKKGLKSLQISPDLMASFKNAMEIMDEGGSVRLSVFLSRELQNRNKTALARAFMKKYPDLEISIYSKSDVESQLDIVTNNKTYVEEGVLQIDKAKNCLKYHDSAIVNVSAKSLHDLYALRRNGLLGMNLRFYVKDKKVDVELEKSAMEHPEEFWYKNNGIVIVCDDYLIDGTLLKLYNFSIINGGQTTNRIGSMDIERDFYIQCKVIIKPLEDTDKFVHEVAIATNSQKPIKAEDLDAHDSNQIALLNRLKSEGVYYKIKRGEAEDKKRYSEPYQVATVKEVGKYGFASILQMPGTARSSSQKMHNSEYFQKLFGPNTPAGYIADSLKIAYYYNTYLKSDNIKKSGFSLDEKAILRNGLVWQISLIALLSKIANGTVSFENDIEPYYNNTDMLKKGLAKVAGSKDRIIKNKVDDEQELFFQLFQALVKDVLEYAYAVQSGIAETAGESINVTNYMKNDSNYLSRNVLKRLYDSYRNSYSPVANITRNILTRKD